MWVDTVLYHVALGLNFRITWTNFVLSNGPGEAYFVNAESNSSFMDHELKGAHNDMVTPAITHTSQVSRR